jgi:CubicO group peptidase (beta-lactamase class C family)
LADTPTVSPIPGLPLTSPEKEGFSSERLAVIGNVMQKYIDNRMIPGSLTVIARHGKIVHHQCRGFMDIEAEKPVADDTIFRLASMTKPFTCVGLMMLYEDGLFLLDQPISSVLPSFKNMVVRGKHDFTEPAHREITFLDCLTHTGGFSLKEWNTIRFHTGHRIPKPLIPGTKDKLANEPPYIGTLEEAVEKFAKRPLNFQPGTDWEYNPGHSVAGVLIEKLSGQPLDVFFRERIFKPLSLNDTMFYLTEEKAPRLAAAYLETKNEWGNLGLIDSPSTSARVTGPKTFFYSAGGLLSTVSDYARFTQMLLNGGTFDGVRIIGRKTLELMTVNHTGNFNIYPMGPGYGYGLGFSVKTSNADSLLPGSPGTFGWDGAYATTFFVDPVEDLFAILLTQVMGNSILGRLRKDFTRLVYQALK